jgi:hypothetical protein
VYARLAKAWDRLVDATLDFIWDMTLPVSTKCPVCAFWRGVLLGVLSTLAIAGMTL